MAKRSNTFLFLLLILFLVASCGIISNNISSSDKTNTESDTPIEKWGWKQIDDGLSYTIVTADKKDLMIVRIDPSRYAFSIYENRNQVNAKTIEQIHKQTGSLLTFNGNFFTEDFKPTGLLITENRMIRDISGADLMDGIIAVDNAGKVSFIHSLNADNFPSDINGQNYNFAIQNGPALIDENGRVLMREDSGIASSRTALGVDKDNNLILVILKQSLLNPDNAISLYKFAYMLKDADSLKDLGLHSVLNLDGGSSTGLMIDDKYFPEMEKVQNVVIVKTKSTP